MADDTYTAPVEAAEVDVPGSTRSSPRISVLSHVSRCCEGAWDLGAANGRAAVLRQRRVTQDRGQQLSRSSKASDMRRLWLEPGRTLARVDRRGGLCVQKKLPWPGGIRAGRERGPGRHDPFRDLSHVRRHEKAK